MLKKHFLNLMTKFPENQTFQQKTTTMDSLITWFFEENNGFTTSLRPRPDRKNNIKIDSGFEFELFFYWCKQSIKRGLHQSHSFNCSFKKP